MNQFKTKWPLIAASLIIGTSFVGFVLLIFVIIPEAFERGHWAMGTFSYVLLTFLLAFFVDLPGPFHRKHP